MGKKDCCTARDCLIMGNCTIEPEPTQDNLLLTNEEIAKSVSDDSDFIWQLQDNLPGLLNDFKKIAKAQLAKAEPIIRAEYETTISQLKAQLEDEKENNRQRIKIIESLEAKVKELEREVSRLRPTRITGEDY